MKPRRIIGPLGLDLLDSLITGEATARHLTNETGRPYIGVTRCLRRLERDGLVRVTVPLRSLGHLGNSPNVWQITNSGRLRLSALLLDGRIPGVAACQTTEVSGGAL